MTFQPISTDEAVRRIQERDHLEAETHSMALRNEDALIALLRDGEIVAGFDHDTRRLAFMKLTGEPVDGQCRGQ